MTGVRHCLSRFRNLEIRLHTLQTSLRRFELMGTLSRIVRSSGSRGLRMSAWVSISSTCGWASIQRVFKKKTVLDFPALINQPNTFNQLLNKGFSKKTLYSISRRWLINKIHSINFSAEGLQKNTLLDFPAPACEIHHQSWAAHGICACAHAHVQMHMRRQAEGQTNAFALVSFN